MRIGYVYSTLVAVSFLAASAANACLYHDPGKCGLSAKSAASLPAVC